MMLTGWSGKSDAEIVAITNTVANMAAVLESGDRANARRDLMRCEAEVYVGRAVELYRASADYIATLGLGR